LFTLYNHLGQAYVLHSEVHTGYSSHLLGVVGHLAEASEECIGASPELAEEIRQYRIALLKKSVEIYDNGEDVQVPYFELYTKIIMLIKEKGCGNCTLATDKLRQLVNNPQLKHVGLQLKTLSPSQ